MSETSVSSDCSECMRSCSEPDIDNPQGPKQPRKRKLNTKLLYACPICQKSTGSLDNHLLDCLNSYLTLDESKNNCQLPLEWHQPFHPVLPTFLPPPSIPLVSTTSADPVRLSALRLNTLSIDIDSPAGQESCRDSNSLDGYCPFCGKYATPLMLHLENCIRPIENPKSIAIPVTTFEGFEKKIAPFFAKPPRPEVWCTTRITPRKKHKNPPGNTVSLCGETVRENLPELGKQRSPRSSPREIPEPMELSPSNHGYTMNALISPRSNSADHSTKESKAKDILTRRWIHESHGSSSHSGHKRRSRDSAKKKEKPTPFNLPIQELPAARKDQAEDEQYDNTVLKIPICTTGPTNSEILKRFPEIDPKCYDLSEIPSGSVVIILSLENMCLCRMSSPDLKIFADGHHADNQDCQFILNRKEGHSGCKFKNVATHKYFMSRESFSNVNNYLTRFKKKQYHCLYFSKGSKEVLIGTAQERSMFRVFKLCEEYQLDHENKAT